MSQLHWSASDRVGMLAMPEGDAQGKICKEPADEERARRKSLCHFRSYWSDILSSCASIVPKNDKIANRMLKMHRRKRSSWKNCRTKQ